MKKSNLKLSILSLLILLIQNSHADEYNYQAGLGSIAYPNRNVAVGSSYRENNVENKNVAGAPDKIIDYATAIGIANKATYHYSSAFGFQNESTADSSSAFGYRNKANRGYSSAFGARNVTKGIYSSAFGYMNKVIGDSSSAFGAKYAVTGNSSGAFGVGKTSFSDEHEYINEGNNSYMIGNKNKIASGSDDNFILGNNVAIGAGITKSVVLGDSSTSGGSNTVSVGSATLKRKIVNVGDGEISATSTDAVTGKQLYSGNGIDTSAWKNKLGVSSGGIINTGIGTDSTAAGVNNIAKGNSSSAFGYRNEASEVNSSAFGYFNSANGRNSSALGQANTASGENGSAFGYFNNATKENSSAFGHWNKAKGKNSSAFGYKNLANGENDSAFGFLNIVNGENSSAFGYRNNIGQLKKDDWGDFVPDVNYGKQSLVFGTKYSVTGNYSGVFGVGELNGNDYKYINEGNNSYMIGNKNKIASGSDDNFILGNNISIGAGITKSVVLGDSSTSGGSNTVSVGSATLKRKIVNVGDGEISATSTDAVTGKQLYSGDGIDTSAWKNKLGVGNTVDLTSYTKRDTSNLTASDVTTWQSKLDVTKKADYKDANDIDVDKWKTKLGVGSGTPVDAYTKTESDNKFVDKTSYNTDKANFATKNDLGKFADASSTNIDVAKWRARLGVGSSSGTTNTFTATGGLALGEGTTVTGEYSTAVGYKNNVSGNHSGAFGDPNVVTGNHSYAFGNNNTINGDNNFVLGNNVTIGAGIQNSVALGNNSTVSSSNEVSVGSKGKERKITNVADGEVSATSTDAVTGKQLYKAMQNSGATGIENLRNEVNEKIDNVEDEVRGVGSLSAALAGLHPMQYDPKAPAQVMAALGQYKNKQSVAVGLSYYFNDRFMMSAGVALSGEKKTKSMANVGFTLKLGKGSGVTYQETPQYVVQNEVKRLTVENQDLKAKVNKQDNKMKEQDEKIKNLEEKLNMLLKNK
ncbi:YadA-like family protein [Fusobacterium vincentii]|uniref:YadA-like family protein n=1 Tax=Fusobacterium vincentii TaxID=155615 RepID=UPI0030D4D3B0